MTVERELTIRARRFAALGEPTRLAIVDELAGSDRTALELQRRFDVPSNRLAYHLDVLEDAGLIRRCPSSGDGRRRYVCLRRDALPAGTVDVPLHPQPALFVCSHNSARSQLAAALWKDLTAADATSAGTHPAGRIHPGAMAAARRAGLDLSGARPRHLDDLGERPDLVVTVCDRAHEELPPDPGWVHWSVPDPVEAGTRAAFDATVDELRARISAVAGPGGGPPWPERKSA